MRAWPGIKAGQETADSERTDSSFLGILLLGLCDELGDVLDWRTVIIVESIALAFDPGFVR